MYITWFSQNTVFSFLLQVYHDVRVTTINSIAKKYFCHYTYMYSYVAFFFCFQIYNLSHWIRRKISSLPNERYNKQFVVSLFFKVHVNIQLYMIKNVGPSEICYD